MSTLDNAVQALFKMAHNDIVWKNASPTSNFNAQSIPATLDANDIVTITFRQRKDNNRVGYAYGDAEKKVTVQVGQRFQVQFAAGQNSDPLIVRFREGAVNSEGVYFYNAMYGTMNTFNNTSNDGVIPVLITKHKA